MLSPTQATLVAAWAGRAARPASSRVSDKRGAIEVILYQFVAPLVDLSASDRPRYYLASNGCACDEANRRAGTVGARPVRGRGLQRIEPSLQLAGARGGCVVRRGDRRRERFRRRRWIG